MIFIATYCCTEPVLVLFTRDGIPLDIRSVSQGIELHWTHADTLRFLSMWHSE